LREKTFKKKESISEKEEKVTHRLLQINLTRMSADKSVVIRSFQPEADPPLAEIRVIRD